MLKTCSKCKQEKEVKDFYWDKTNKHYKRLCRICCNKYHVGNYAQTTKGKTAVNKASMRSYAKHKEKWLARAKVRLAIQNGVINKPKKCEVCEEVKPLQGHHEDYSKPLEVIFLCFSCHATADKLLENITKVK